MAPKIPFKPRTRAQAALHMKDLTINTLHRTITRLRADLGKRRHENERLSEEKEMVETHRHQLQHQLEISRGDNFDLRDSIEVSQFREKKLTEDVERYTKEIASGGKKFDEAWSTIMHLSEVNENLTKRTMKLKEKKQQMAEKYQGLHSYAQQLLNEADNGIQGLKDQVAELIHENTQLQFVIADMQAPELEEDPEENPEEEPVEIVEDPVVEDPEEGNGEN